MTPDLVLFEGRGRAAGYRAAAVQAGQPRNQVSDKSLDPAPRKKSSLWASLASQRSIGRSFWSAWTLVLCHVGTPGCHFGAPDCHFGAPGCHFGAQGYHFGAPGKQFGMPGYHFGAPGYHFGAPGKAIWNARLPFWSAGPPFWSAVCPDSAGMAAGTPAPLVPFGPRSVGLTAGTAARPRAEVPVGLLAQCCHCGAQGSQFGTASCHFGARAFPFGVFRVSALGLPGLRRQCCRASAQASST